MKARIVSTDLEMDVGYVPHPGYGIHKGHYGFWTIKKNKAGEITERFFNPIGLALEVKEVLINIETAEKTLRLLITDLSGMQIEVDMPRELMTVYKLPELVKYGAQVTKDDAPVLINCLENLEVSAPVSYEYKKTGFDIFNGELVFKANTLITKSDMKGSYIGDVKIEPRGSREVWLDMVRTEVMGTKLEVILSMALSSVVFDFVHQQFPAENLVVALTGLSSSGKTTALNLAVSTGALPVTADNSLLLTFLDTELSIMHRMMSGYCVGIDEGSTLKKKDTTKILYSIANGKERARMTKTLEMAESVSFHSVVFTSSETSLLAQADNNAGLRVRVLELSAVWTKSAESSDKIKEVVTENYGWAIPEMAEYLLNKEPEKIVKRCKYWTEVFKEYKSENSDIVLLGRLAKKMGIILATAEIAEEVFGLQFDTEKICEFLVEQVLVNPQEYDIGIRAYSVIIAYYTAHPEEFGENLPSIVDQIYRKNGYVSRGKFTTLYDGTQSTKILHIKQETFEKVMDDNRFPDIKSVLVRLRELNLLVSDKDRLVSKLKLGTSESPVYTTGYRFRLRDCEKQETKFVPADDEHMKQMKLTGINPFEKGQQ